MRNKELSAILKALPRRRPDRLSMDACGSGSAPNGYEGERLGAGVDWTADLARVPG
jgi:hypothetical protein